MKGMITNMAKRKAEVDAAQKNNTTPKKNLAESEFAADYASGETTDKRGNRNSKKGFQGE